MFRNNIAFKGICTLILFITMGISQVSLDIRNPTFSIDVCSDPTYNLKPTCEAGIPTWTSSGLTWNGTACSDPSFTTETTCEAAGTCSDPNFTNQRTCVGGCSVDTYTNKTSCTDAGKTWTEAGTPYWTTFTLDINMTNQPGCSFCSDNGYDNQAGCESYGSSDGGITTDGVWTFDTSITDSTTCEGAAKNGAYFSGEVMGFNFYLDGIEVAGVSGGTAAQYLSIVDLNSTTGKVLGVSTTGVGIPAGNNVLLTTMRFSTTGEVSCF